MENQNYEFSLLGDTALCVKLGDRISEDINNMVLNLCDALESLCLPGVSEIQPSYTSLAVHFDSNVISPSYIRKLISSLQSQTHMLSFRKPTVAEIPVCYGGDYGPDLQWASQYLGISEEEIINRHSSRLYRVYMIGFTPGFPYLGGLDETISLPRLDQPREKVPKGSIGIASNQTGIYPWDTPGGWRIIGRTNYELFSPEMDPPSLLEPGDYVKFVPVHRLPEQQVWQRKEINHLPKIDLGVNGLTVSDPGLLTLVVDQGRFGYRKFGVPVSGAADMRSFTLANVLCGNNPDAAALELTVKGPTLVAETDLTVAVTGAPCSIKIDGRPAPADAALLLREGQTIEIGQTTLGLRAYLGVSGGIEVPHVLNSKSTYLRAGFGGYFGRPLKHKDTIKVGPLPTHGSILEKAKSTRVKTSRIDFRMLKAPAVPLRIITGPESTDSMLATLLTNIYQVRTESDRMGIRLEGPKLSEGKADIISAPVVPGTIQVSSDGQPMMLLADSQTTGGYKRAATVISHDLPLAAQLKPGNKVRFRSVDPVHVL
ncbi:MAG: 5-oxoprolinase subunit PxpB [Bacillota bacterium]